MLKSQNGITLVALVVTIIVLIILATVSISLALNPNGIINRAEQAANVTAIDDAKWNAFEQNTTELIDRYLQNYEASKTTP